jgi:hypothetical protein
LPGHISILYLLVGEDKEIERDLTPADGGYILHSKKQNFRTISQYTLHTTFHNNESLIKQCEKNEI